MTKAIQFNHVSFAYESSKWVLKNISLSINEGSYTVILGHNGSGKSTLAKLIIGLISPQEGNILVQGSTVSPETVSQVRQKVGIVFQNPDNQFIGATVRDDIAFGLENHNVPSEKMDTIISEFAHQVGMSEFLDKEPTHLSGGQKQRVAIAGVLAMAPQIIILDEATSMLDPKGKNEIKELTKRMRALYPGLTILSITHDVEEALLADEVIVLNEGSIHYQGTSHGLFSQPLEKLQQIRLDRPFTYQLVNQLAGTHKGVHATHSLEALAEELWTSILAK